MATYDPFRDLDRLASTLFDARRGPRRMPMDLYRDGDHYVLTADLPGIDPGSVDIDVDGQLLTIRAERTLAVGEGVKWITREREARELPAPAQPRPGHRHRAHRARTTATAC